VSTHHSCVWNCGGTGCEAPFKEPRRLDDQDIFVWAACTHIRNQYPTDIWPDDGMSIDCKSAKMARLTCDNVWRYYLEQKDLRSE
jgi:hypothetical protein